MPRQPSFPVYATRAAVIALSSHVHLTGAL